MGLSATLMSIRDWPVRILGKFFSGIRNITSYILKPLLGEFPLSKTLNFVWLLAGIYTWGRIATGERGLDLLLSGAVLVVGCTLFCLGVIAFVLNSFKIKYSMSGMAIINSFFFFAFWGTFFFTSMIAGDWNTADKIPVVCQGTFHFHHWLVSLLVIALLLSMPRQEQIRLRIAWCGLCYGVSITLWIIVLLSMANFRYFLGNISLQIEFGIIGFFLFATTLVASSKETSSTWFKIYMTLSLGVQLAIFANGAVGILKEYAKGDKIPSSFIFFNDEVNCPTK